MNREKLVEKMADEFDHRMRALANSDDPLKTRYAMSGALSIAEAGIFLTIEEVGVAAECASRHLSEFSCSSTDYPEVRGLLEKCNAIIREYNAASRARGGDDDYSDDDYSDERT